MKPSLRKLFGTTTLGLMQLYTIAQDTTTTAINNVTATSSVSQPWYLQTWAMVAGGVILLVLMIAIFGGSNKKNNTQTDRVVVTKTVTTTSERD